MKDKADVKIIRATLLGFTVDIFMGIKIRDGAGVLSLFNVIEIVNIVNRIMGAYYYNVE